MLNIAQIGVGYWGPNLLKNLVANTKCEVPCVAEIAPDRCSYVRRLYPAIAVTDDPETVFQDSRIDAVVVATPVATHYDLAMRALRSRKHVLVEKPLARTVQEVEDIAKLSSEVDRVAMVGHTFLFNNAVRYVKGLIDKGEVGEIYYIYCQRLNLGRIRSDVDALWNLGPHDISIIQYWLGDPTPLSIVRSGMAYMQSGIEDVVFLTIQYPHNIIANLHVSWLDPHKVRSITVVGSKKMILYDDTVEHKIAIYDKGIDRIEALADKTNNGNQRLPAFNHRSGDVLLPNIDFQEPLKLEIDHFIDCITNRTPCLTGVDHARRVVDILASGNGRSHT